MEGYVAVVLVDHVNAAEGDVEDDGLGDDELLLVLVHGEDLVDGLDEDVVALVMGHPQAPQVRDVERIPLLQLQRCNPSSLLLFCCEASRRVYPCWSQSRRPPPRRRRPSQR